MAQNECQQMSKDQFYNNLRSVLTNTYQDFQRLERISEFLETMDVNTLDNMGVPATGSDEGLRTALSQLRTAVNEILGFYSGSATTQTQVLKDKINILRYI